VKGIDIFTKLISRTEPSNLHYKKHKAFSLRCPRSPARYNQKLWT